MTSRVSFIPKKSGTITLFLRSDYQVSYSCYVNSISATGCELKNGNFEEIEDGYLKHWDMQDKGSLISNLDSSGNMSVRVTHDEYISQDILVAEDVPIEIVVSHRCIP